MKIFSIMIIVFNFQLLIAQAGISTNLKISNMTKQILNDLLIQNQITNGTALEQVSNENIEMRLNDGTATVGFIYRHIGETIHLLSTFLGEQTTIRNTTMGQQDIGQGKTLTESQQLVRSGFVLLQNIIDKNSETWWLEEIDTPFFGKVSRLRLFCHILYHNSHHAGQISLTISKGSQKH